MEDAGKAIANSESNPGVEVGRGGGGFFFFAAFALWMCYSTECITSAAHSRALSGFFLLVIFFFFKIAMAASASQWISCYGSESASAIIYSKTVWADYLVDRMPRHLRPGGAAVHQAKMAFFFIFILPNGRSAFFFFLIGW